MRRRGGFYRVRVTLLLTVLAAVSLWACYDVRARRARNQWETPVRVGLVLLQRGNVDPGAMLSLLKRSAVLEQRLGLEFARYRPALGVRMIDIQPYGPVRVSEAPPSEPGTAIWDRLIHAYRLWRYTENVDRMAGVPTRDLDSRIYVLAEPGNSTTGLHVEGFSENGGRVGVARVELDRTSVDLALFVAAHELFHTLGASDKYDATGRTRFPEGLPDPDRVPLFPQPAAEIMARNRVISPAEEVVPDSLRELSVGTQTAREVGWLD
jgi:hypothetical protein